MTVIVPLVTAAFAIVVSLGLGLAAQRAWLGMPSGFYMTAAAARWMINVLVLLSIVITCFHISREFAFGTVKPAWSRPVTRHAWYTGKVISACAIVTVLFAVVIFCIIAVSALRFGFNDLMEKDYLVHSAASMGGKLACTAVLTLWSLWAVTVVTAMLAVLFNHPGGGIAASLGLGLLMTVLGIFPPVRPFLLGTFINMPLEQMVAMSQGLPLPFEWSRLVLWTIVGGGAWLTAGLILGVLFIRRKEITF